MEISAVKTSMMTDKTIVYLTKLLNKLAVVNISVIILHTTMKKALLKKKSLNYDRAMEI
jgi:hypothetical protein